MSEQLNRTHVRSTEIQLETTNELPTIIKERGFVNDMEKHYGIFPILINSKTG